MGFSFRPTTVRSSLLMVGRAVGELPSSWAMQAAGAVLLLTHVQREQ
jgi:hypothetical protein